MDYLSLRDGDRKDNTFKIGDNIIIIKAEGYKDFKIKIQFKYNNGEGIGDFEVLDN